MRLGPAEGMAMAHSLLGDRSATPTLHLVHPTIPHSGAQPYPIPCSGPSLLARGSEEGCMVAFHYAQQLPSPHQNTPMAPIPSSTSAISTS